MELLDRYLQAVKKHLPWQRQNDILAELRANLESQLEDKESELGRTLTTPEAEEWLKQIGPPMLVAARYQPQQYLIGPAIFPTYWFVLRTALFWALIIYSVVNAILLALANHPTTAAVAEAIFQLPGVMMTVAAWVTLIFASFEFAAANYGVNWPPFPRLPANWTPATLPPLEKTPAPGEKPRSFAHAVADVVFGFLFIIWLLLIPRYPYLLMGPGVLYLHFSAFQIAPVWIQFYWWMVGLNVFQLAWRSLDLWSGAWQARRPWKTIAFKALGLIPVGFLLTAPGHILLTLRNPELDQAQYGATLTLINKSVHLSLALVCAIVVLQLLWDVVQIVFNDYRKRAAAAH
jgi:hypothetical protein